MSRPNISPGGPAMTTSEFSSPRAGQQPRVPISLEGERRKAMKLVFAMEKDCENFREKWLLHANDDNSDEWAEFVNQIKTKTGSSNTIFRSCKDFEKELVKVRQDPGFLGGRLLTVEQLQKVCDRAKAFEKVFDIAYTKVEDALKHYMAKYCLSFFAELDEMDVECVRDYENSISDWEDEIKGGLKEAEKAMESINDVLNLSFIHFLTSYGQVLQAMHSALDAFMSVADPFRSWVTLDEAYVKKIRFELTRLESQKVRIGEQVRKKSFKVHEEKSQGLRLSFNNRKLKEQVKGTVTDRRRCRNREFSFVDKIEITEHELKEKRVTLDQARGKLLSRPLHTLVRESTDGMTDKSASLHREVVGLERQLQKMKQGKRDMRENRYHLQKQYHSLQGTYENSVRKAQRQTDECHHRIQSTRDLSAEQRLLERKIRALRSIIYIKTHPATVKKIYFDGYAPGERIDFRGAPKPTVTVRDPADTLSEAIDVAASGVGKDWSRMYHQLPFNPPRTAQRRYQDLELMDMDFRSIHPPSKQMALRSLDKWKSLSNVTSVNALVRTLKSIKKAEVAKQIEKQVLTVVN